MRKVILKITLTLEGPLLSQSSAPGIQGLDVLVCRNHKEQACLPGTLISGKLRQAWEELDNASAGKTWFQPRIDQWLGKESKYEMPRRKQLFFSDFVLEAGQDCAEPEQIHPNQDAIRHRISIDPERGAVKEHQLLMIESPFVSGEQYRFSGEVHFFSPSENEADQLIRYILTGIKWFSQIGAMRTVGFGRVVKAELTESVKTVLPKPGRSAALPANKRISLRIEPLYPFCIAGKLTDNMFEPEAIISGGTLLACIATTWSHLTGQQVNAVSAINDPVRQELKENFNRLRISHAFPGSPGCKGKRPVVAPLSLVQIDGDKENLYDVARLNAPCLINNKPPDFAVDWKDTDKTLRGYPWPYIRRAEWGWAKLATELRVRSAIDRNHLRSAEGQLFSYERMIPDNICWYAELDLSRIQEQERGPVLTQLESLLDQGITALGKTKTPAGITFAQTAIQLFFPIANLQAINDDQWIITLQTDTLLGSPEKLCASSGSKDLLDMYEQAWAELSKEGDEMSGDTTMTLVRYFVRQKLFGGRYRHEMAKRQRTDAEYRPWLLTEAGSVFVLRAVQGKADAAQQKITDWLAQGLPLSSSVCQCYGISAEPEQQWQETPFLPRNGYGEIAVNIDMRKIPGIQELRNGSPEVDPIPQLSKKTPENKEEDHDN